MANGGPCGRGIKHPMRRPMTNTFKDPMATPLEPHGTGESPGRRRASRCARVIGLNMLRGAASAVGTGAISWLILWLQGH